MLLPMRAFDAGKSNAWSLFVTLNWDKRLQGDGVEQEDFWGSLRGFERQEVGWIFVVTRTVFTSDVVPDLIGGGLGKEV